MSKINSNKKAGKQLKINKMLSVDSVKFNKDCPPRNLVKGADPNVIDSYTTAERRTWDEVDLSMSIILWAKSVQDKDNLEFKQALYFDMLFNDAVQYEGKQLILGMKGVNTRLEFNKVFETLMDFGDPYLQFCVYMAGVIGCQSNEVFYSINRIDWSDKVNVNIGVHASPRIMKWFKDDWEKTDDDPFLMIIKSLTQDSFQGVRFGDKVRGDFNNLCEKHVIDDDVNDMELLGKDYFDKYTILASRDMRCFPSEISNLLHRRSHKILEIRSPEFEPISKWMASVRESGSFSKETAAFYRLCNGKKARINGQKLPPGQDFVDAINKCLEGTDLTYDDYVYTIKKSTKIKSRLVRQVIEKGPKSFESVTEIANPDVNATDEKEFSYKEHCANLELKSDYIDINKDRDIHGKESKKTKEVLHKSTEWWPIDKTEKLCRDLARDTKIWIFFDILRTARVSECKNYYLVDVDYRHSATRDSGRLYADGASFQSLNGPMRRFMCNEEHIQSGDWVLKDIDVDNCFPVLLNQIGKRHGLELNAMIEYVQNREQILIDAMKLYGCDRKLAKKIFLIEMHGGHFWKEMCEEHGFTKQVLSKIKFPFMDRFKKDIRIAFDRLKHTDEFKGLYDGIEQDDSKRNKRGTFISYICQDAESMVISQCVEFCKKYNYELSTLVFDGFMVKWCIDDSKRDHNNMDDFLRSVEKWVRDTTGYDLGFSNKPLEMEDKDHIRLSPKSIEQNDYYGDCTRVIELADMPIVQTTKGPRPVMHDITDDKRCTVITAGMYIGKSTTTYNYLKDKLRDPTKTAIAISVRKQHARTIMGQLGGLGFKHYQQDSKIHGRYVCQYESLHKIFESITEGGMKYDYVILDESHSIIKNMVSETNKRNLKRAEQTLRLILQSSTKVIALDADNLYDQSVPQYLSEIFDKNDIEHLWYKHQALKRKVIYTDTPTMMRSIRDDMENNRNVMVCFKSCERLTNWLEQDISGQYYTNDDGKEVQLKLGLKYGVRSFSSNTTTEEMKVFENINDLPSEGLFLAFTSKVLVGADILIPFHRLYLDANGFRGPTARQMIQMLGRGRVCETGEIMVSMPQPKKTSLKQKELNYETLYKSQFKDLQKMRERRSEYVDTILSEHNYKFSDGNIEWTPEPILNVYAHKEVEVSREFPVEFHRLIHIKGYEVDFKFRQTSVVDELDQLFDWKASLDELRLRKHLKLSDALESIKDMDIHTILQSCSEIRENRVDFSKSEQLVNDVLFACKMIPEYYKEVDSKTIKYMIDNKSIVYMALDMGSASDPKIYLRDITNMRYAAIPELAKLRGTFIKRMDRLLRTVGFTDGILDRETAVMEGPLGEQLSKYSLELAKLKIDRGANCRVRSTKKINILRSELKMIGLTLKSNVTRHSKTSWSTRYRIVMNTTLESILPHIRRNYEIESDNSMDTDTTFKIVDRDDNYIENSLMPAEDSEPEEPPMCDGPLEWEHVAPKIEIKHISDESALGEMEVEVDVSRPAEDIKASGVLPWTIDNDGNQMVLIQKMDDGQFQDFGGKLDNDESFRDAAHREMMEESNNKITFITNEDIHKSKFVENRGYAVILPYVKYDQDIQNIDYGDCETHTGYKRTVKWVEISTIKSSDLNWRLRGALWNIKKTIYQNS